MRFIRNPFAERELEQALMRAGVMDAYANDVARAAQSAAPRKTGAYERSIQTDGNTVYSTDPFAHLIEWGSANNPPYAPLRRGVLAAGLRLDESR